MPVAATYRRPYRARKSYAPKRNYRAKRPYKRRAASKTVANQVKRVLNRAAEKKWYDQVINSASGGGNLITIRNWGTVQNLTNIQPNASSIGRVGDFVTVTNMELKIHLYYGIPRATWMRVVIFKVKNTGFVPKADTLTDNGSFGHNIVSGNMDSALTRDPSRWDPMSRQEAGQSNLSLIRTRWYNQGTKPDRCPMVVNMKVPVKTGGKIHFNNATGIADHAYYAAITFWYSGLVAGDTLTPAGSKGASGDLASYQAICRVVYTDL
jgi:hypothetical protein